ncbi:MAG: ABC transporter ATP-binding protein [Lachnospiraceae bacterium]
MKKNYFLACMMKYAGYFIMGLILSYGLASIVVKGNKIVSQAIDTLLSGGNVEFAGFIKFFLLLVLLGFVFAFLKSVFNSKFAICVQRKYKELLAKKLYVLEYKYFDENGSASVINKMNSDIAETDALLNETLPDICKSIIEMAVYAFYVCQINVKLFILMLISYPLVLMFTRYVADKLTSLKKVFRQKSDLITETAQDSVSGILVLRAFGAESFFQKKLDAATMDLVDNEAKRTRMSNTVIIVRRLLSWLPNIACAVYAYVLVIRGSISIGELMAFIIILERFVSAFTGVPFGMVDAKEQYVCVKRVEHILNSEDEISGECKTIENADTVIEFDNVSFAYNEGKTVIDNVSFTIEKGKRVAFAGESGGGKSTIFRLICGFYPVKSGEYRLYGRNISMWDVTAARETMALVSQNVFLFPTSVYENVRYGNPDATYEEIITACKKARIHDFVTGLLKGYDTVVGERGILLSGGEKQRISIARAFLKNASILLLDEPTSAVDVETEKLIKETIDELSENRTCIVIAHRLSTISNMDEIMVLKDGRIVECGTHDELIDKNGVYASMYGKEIEGRNA